MALAHTASEMIKGMSPRLRSGRFVFATTTDPDQAARLISEALCIYREAEGLSLILPLALASREGLACDLPMICITLEVFSALQGVGLTAAVSAALAGQGIPCNMVAAYHHDHVFVPESHSGEAMRALIELQAGQGGD
ncbi:ACT domain-containing protein [Paracoccus ravus]|uniref:ACT domain-containing protein n=1 Tax=Paracoccus ravus TaxID=2447760 RepID=UPI001ADB9EFE|nr:ACT domain-containing protein [Paracoccus ravus]